MGNTDKWTGFGVIAVALDADVDVEAPKITGGKDDQGRYLDISIRVRRVE